MRRRLGARDGELAYSEILKLRVRAMQNCDSVCSDTTKLLPTASRVRFCIAVVPAKRATASASRDPVTPVVLMRADRDYWIPAFAGMTLVR
jgi:hypothetical protein